MGRKDIEFRGIHHSPQVGEGEGRGGLGRVGDHHG